MKKATAIFYGKVIDAELQWAKIEVLAVYKNNGFVKDTVEVGYKTIISSCGMDFVTGETALVYSYSNSNQFGATLCSATILSIESDWKKYRFINQQRKRLRACIK